MSDLSFQSASESDWPAVTDLLVSAGLPLDGARAHLGRFVLARRGEKLVGCAGLECYAESGLLRSVAVAEAERGAGLGQALVRRVLARARADGLRQIVLLTETAPDFFTRFGFRVIARAQAPEAVTVSEEFASACPASATVLALYLT